jgi:Fic family protein
MYVRKEAVLSSMIEGTQSSLSDLLLFELDPGTGVPLDDVREVTTTWPPSTMVCAGLGKGSPCRCGMLKEIHAVLLRQGRGGNQTPGEFRRSQNWIGGTRPGNAAFVPPPPHRSWSVSGSRTVPA